MAGVVDKGIVEIGEMSGDVLAGTVKLDPRVQLETLFPKLKGHLDLVKVESLALGCDRHQNISDVDYILERAGIYIRQCGYQKIYDLAEPKVVGDSLFLEAKVYLVNGFKSQSDTIGVTVGKFFSTANEEYASQQARWNGQGYEIYHYMVAGKCPKNAKFVVLATLIRKKPAR